MRATRLRSVPTEGLTFPRLQSLVLAENALQELPRVALAAFPVLRLLDLTGNRALTLSSDVFAGVAGLQSLAMGNLQPTPTLPPGLFSSVPNLVTLDLSFNSLASLSAADFSNLTNLEAVDLEGNAGAVFPDLLFTGLDSLRAAVFFDVECPAGYGSAFNDPRQSTGLCLRCSPGTYKPRGAANLLDCVSCPAGYVRQPTKKERQT